MGWPLGLTMLPDGKEHKSNRIKCLGNGQVPLCAAMAFTILWDELNDRKSKTNRRNPPQN